MKKARVIIGADIIQGRKTLTLELDNCVFVLTDCKPDIESLPNTAVILENKEVDELKGFLREWASYSSFADKIKT